MGRGRIIRERGGWRIEDKGEIVDRTRAFVVDDLALAKALENVPNLADRKTKSDIKRAVTGLQRKFNSLEVLSSFDEKVKDKNEPHVRIFRIRFFKPGHRLSADSRVDPFPPPLPGFNGTMG